MNFNRKWSELSKGDYSYLDPIYANIERFESDLSEINREIAETKDEKDKATLMREAARVNDAISKEKARLEQLSKNASIAKQSQPILARINQLKNWIANWEYNAKTEEDPKLKADYDKKVKRAIEEIEELERDVDKAVDTSYAGDIPKSGLAKQDLEGETTKAEKNLYVVIVKYQGDAQVHVKSYEISATSTEEALNLGIERTNSDVGRGTFGTYNMILSSQCSASIKKTVKSVLKGLADEIKDEKEGK